MLETLVIDSEAVLRAWLNPPPACRAPATKPVRLPESWTVVTSATGDPWTGDVPLLVDGSYTDAMVRWIYVSANTPAFPTARV
jgi:hypothetical protein